MALDGEKITLCWPNYVNDATIEGGSWASQMPVDFLKSQLFSRKAVSTSLSLTDTQIKAYLPRFRPVYLVAIAAHNLSTVARWRVRLYYNQDYTDLRYDSGWADVWPAIFSTAELEWEYDNFWLGTLNEDDREGFTPLNYIFLPESYIAQSIHIELDDASNSDGYLAIGRLVVSDAWQPDINMSYGVEYGFENNTTVEEANDPNRTEHFDPAVPKRTVSFTLDTLSENEAINRIHRMHRVQGVNKEVFVTEGVNYRPENLGKTFIGRVVNPDPISQPYLRVYSSSLSLKEIL